MSKSVCFTRVFHHLHTVTNKFEETAIRAFDVGKRGEVAVDKVPTHCTAVLVVTFLIP